jgi:hypothetical protein
MKRQVEEEGLARVAAVQEVDRLGDHPIGGVQAFGASPRAGHHRIAVQAVLGVVGVDALAGLAPQPRQVVVAEAVVDGAVASVMQVAVVQHHLVEAQPIAGGRRVHLADRAGLEALPRELARHGDGEVPLDAVAITHPPVVTRRQPRVQRGARGNATGRSGIGPREAGAPPRQVVEVRRADDGVPGGRQTVAAPLVGHDENHVRRHDRIL